MQVAKKREALLTDYFTREQARFYRLAYSYLKNREEALDAVQTAVCRAWERQDSLRDPSALHTWFCRISTWKRQKDGYRLQDTSNYVVTESRAMSMRPKGPEEGFMEISDPLTGTTGFRFQNVYRDEVTVLEYVRTDNADRFFATQPPMPVGVGA